MIFDVIIEEIVKGAVSATIIGIGAYVFVSLIKHNLPKWYLQWKEFEAERHKNKMIELKMAEIIRDKHA